jgi:hypothetical protein
MCVTHGKQLDAGMCVAHIMRGHEY